MRIFKNYWSRRFAIAFLLGAMLPPVALATGSFKGLEVSIGKFHFYGARAWMIATVFSGVTAGILGLGVAATKQARRSKLSKCDMQSM